MTLVLCQCAWCCRIRLSGRWLPFPLLLRWHGRRWGFSALVSHGICPACAEEMAREIAEWRRVAS